MSSNLKVNTILPSTGTTIGIGTVGGLINVVGNIDVNSTSGISTFNGLEISGIVTAKAGAAVTYYGDGSNLTGITDNVVTINNNANNRVITGSGSANTLEGESTLTYAPSILTITNASGASEITLVTPSANDSGVYFNDGSNAGALTYVHSDNSMRFRVNSTEKLRIDLNGNLVLGATTYQNGGFGGTSHGINIAGTQPQILLHETDTNKDGYFGLAGSILRIQTADAIPVTIWTSDTRRVHIHETNGNMTLETGNLVMGTAGKGIDFSSAADDSTNISETVDSSVLDDYEEGQFTPAVQFDSGGGSIVYGTRYGRYRKVGNMVHITYYMEIASGVSSSDFFARLSLPFNGYGGAVGHQDARIRQWNTGVSDWFVSLGGSAPVFFMNNGNGSGVNYARGDDINGYKLSGQYTLYT